MTTVKPHGAFVTGRMLSLSFLRKEPPRLLRRVLDFDHFQAATEGPEPNQQFK